MSPKTAEMSSKTAEMRLREAASYPRLSFLARRVQPWMTTPLQEGIWEAKMVPLDAKISPKTAETSSKTAEMRVREAASYPRLEFLARRVQPWMTTPLQEGIWEAKMVRTQLLCTQLSINASQLTKPMRTMQGETKLLQANIVFCSLVSLSSSGVSTNPFFSSLHCDGDSLTVNTFSVTETA